jgi:hypothetical protein
MSDAAQMRHVTKAAIHVLIKRRRLNRFYLFGQVLLSKKEVESFRKNKPGPRTAGNRKG